jgi:CRISPR-associated protein Cas1
MKSGGDLTMAILYVTQPGAEIRKHGERLKVQWQDEVITAIPLRDVERIVLFGPVQLSAAAAQTLLKKSIPVVFATTKGRYCGALSSGQENTELLIKQVDLHRDDGYRLLVAKAIVSAKIKHQRSLLRRYERNHPHPDIHEAADGISDLLSNLENTTSVSEAMGFEGQASALYFGVFGKCLRQEGVEFTHRNRRPPRDPVNALLSLGYMLVMGEAVGALAALGLHLGLGFLHEIFPNRPSLALDLLEIFRQPVVDRLTLTLFNRRIFAPDDFQERENDGVRLTEEGLKRYFFLYERAMTTPFQQDGNNGEVTSTLTFRKLITEMAQNIRNAIRDAEPWTPKALEL